ncbi:MAG: bifunctional phosphopantothenoylcysteine decarboxylase/phosphopantothenate--cysteine ligase CoaBC [Gammaproteobacteria bacterium]|nr:bifunctional phosphopantothenoylcysteine decarboxylase/phosphopantothenate--cysteine ligase CoaBC [Gammaproteobacteria bacterium]TVQ49776.1 MAG: bifunctional phosphopantothenoylcysteine decarboxylase/phosphopantothenate--cysteine ligase CoaBC [Gammaproteobacteria bacterium]
MAGQQRVLLGVTGGIAAYKSAELVRALRERGCEVQVVMTRGAREFIGAATLQALSGRPVREDLWDAAAEAAMGHIELARWADCVLIAPATAQCLARLAHGLADDLLSTLCLATDAPVYLAPAMNRLMWAHPATRANCEVLAARGVTLLGPGIGDQACGETGPGRMLEPQALVAAVLKDPAGPLAGRTVMITAGPTREPIDPVRYLTNRSSGKMGFALAAAAREAGARVVLVTGPVALATPPGVERVDVETAAELHEAVHRRVGDCDIFIGAAAVADYRPREYAGEKIKKRDATLTLTLDRSPDVLASVAALASRPFTVGFAAETCEVERHAREKLARKQLDMIVANQVGPGRAFDTEDNELLVLWPEEGCQVFARAPKRELAEALIALIATRSRPEDAAVVP